MADPIFPFTVALFLLAGLVLLEIMLMFLGAGPLSFIDDLLPDLGEADAPETLSLSKALGFFGIGKVPVLMVLMSFLAMFGLSGFLMQRAAASLTGGPLALSAAVPGALAIAIVLTGRIAALLAQFLPAEQSTAVSKDSLIGRVATITFGDATFTRPAAAKVRDRHGNVHHIQVMSNAPETLLPEGSEAKLVSRHNGAFIGIPVPPSET